jgi:hypothetical protein
LWLLAFPMRTTSCAVNSNLDDVWAGGTEVRKAATARWESVDWVPLTYPDPSTSLTSAVYLACLVFFLAFLLLARRERL